MTDLISITKRCCEINGIHMVRHGDDYFTTQDDVTSVRVELAFVQSNISIPDSTLEKSGIDGIERFISRECIKVSAEMRGKQIFNLIESGLHIRAPKDYDAKHVRIVAADLLRLGLQMLKEVDG